VRHLWLLVLLGGLVIVGCKSAEPVTLRSVRDQLVAVEEGERLDFLRKHTRVDRIRDAATLEDTGPITLRWYSLVVGLQGTGTRGVPDQQIEPNVTLRSELKLNLVRNGMEDGADDILGSPDTAPVEVVARVPPLTNTNDRLDVVVQALGGATSLRYGVLATTELRRVEGLGGPAPRYLRVWAKAEGRIALSSGRLAFGEAPTVAPTRGYVAAAAPCNFTRFLGLRLREADPYAAFLVTMTINERFPGSAYLITGQTIRIVCPEYYRQDWRRFAQVLMEIRCRPTTSPIPGRSKLNSLLAELQSEDADRRRRAALKLEALGRSAVPVLERGLSSSRPAVRMAAAQALAAMREPAAIQPLFRFLEAGTPEDRHRAARYLNFYTQGNVQEYQRRLLADPDPEIRFRALLGLERAQAEAPIATHQPAQDEDFRITRVNTAGRPALVVKARNPRRFVFFGPAVALKPPFHQEVAQGDLIVEATQGSAVTIRYVVLGQECERRLATTDLDELVEQLDRINVTVNDIMDLIFKLSRADAITGDVLFLDE